MGIFIFLMAAIIGLCGISAWIGYSIMTDRLEEERDANRRLRLQVYELNGRLDSAEYQAFKLQNQLTEYKVENKSGSIKDDVRKIKVVM